ncbi:MAG: efflux RND transporter permease subunit [Cyanobacteria bacterium P01_F01_bin.53]
MANFPRFQRLWSEIRHFSYVVGRDSVTATIALKGTMMSGEIEAKLAELGLTAEEVSSRIGNADSKVASGAVRTRQSDTSLEIAGAFESIDRIRNIPVLRGSDGAVLRIGDIAKVQRRWLEPAAEIAIQNGSRSIFVAARMLEDRQVGKWMKSANRLIEEFELTLSPQIRVERVFEQEKYTVSRLSELALNLLLGSIVVVLVVFVTMGWRSALLVGLALPLVSGMVLFSLQLLGVPLHQMSIFGLIVAIGLLIDNAIVVVDDVSERIRSGESGRQARMGSKRVLRLFK